MGEETGLPKIPCVYCSHPNPPGHRFCGMCGKALPDLVKQAARAADDAPRPAGSSTPSSIPSPARSPAITPRHENPNRDLSYLLHDDHKPAPTNRKPFIVGGLVLAAVAAFFAMRGGGKAATPGTAAGESTSTQSADPATAPDAAPPAETAKTETPVPKVEPKVEPKAEAAQPVRHTASAARQAHRPAPATAVAHAYVPKPTPAKKPSPAKQETAAPDDTTASSVPAAVNEDCDKRLPALRKAAAAGSAKARADLGLVYYAGRCVPRDLPTSYRYYALALRTAPDSPLVSAQLEAIWKQMSPAERQLAQKPQ